ncbi:TspO/MBR family protein [Kamptonema cortianum]|nr:TspO/MBR family protein [Kamptonema cortianum]
MVFFGLCNPCYALVNIMILLALIIFLIIVFLPLNRLAAALLIPYMLWVAFASYLNFQIWIQN